MKKIFFIFLIILIFWGVLIIPGLLLSDNLKTQNDKNADSWTQSKDIQHSINTTEKARLGIHIGKIPLYFISNECQVNQKAKFYSRTANYTLWLTKNSLIFDSFHKIQLEKKNQINYRKVSLQKEKSLKFHRNVSQFVFLNANDNIEILPIEKTKLRVNYFKGNDKSRWNINIPTSRAVLYKNLYNKIDLKVYGVEKQIEYDWIVKPGGNPNNIQFEYKNVNETRLDSHGNLIIETDFGELIHKKPLSYQLHKYQNDKCLEQKEREKGDPIEVDVRFKKINKNTYGFVVGEYNKKYELIIDPAVLAYSTYLGGGGYDTGRGIAVDNSGNVYITGITASLDFPVENQYQIDPVDLLTDIFVSKIDTTESGVDSLLYSTYIGGNGLDEGFGIAVDGMGKAYVTGNTESSDFPLINQYQDYPRGGRGGLKNVFLIKLDTHLEGSKSLVYSTYIGGERDEVAFSIAVDDSENAYITGYTESEAFPVLNEYQGYCGGIDTFVMKLDTKLSGISSLIYSTFLGGDGDERGYGITVDNSEVVYITGSTNSMNYPTRDQFQSYQGDIDAFITKLDTKKSGTSSLIYSTYLGGKQQEEAFGIAVDNYGYAYVTGLTYNIDFPAKNQCRIFNNTGNSCAFITMIDTNQSGSTGLIYSSSLGLCSGEEGRGIAVDNYGNVYVTGIAPPDFPTLNQNLPDQEASGAFITMINTSLSEASTLIYSTILGGSGDDQGFGITVDGHRFIYVTGMTGSSNFPLKNQCQVSQGNHDAFVVKLFNPVAPPMVITESVSDVSATNATCGGNVVSQGGDEVCARGVCCSTTPNPTIFNVKTTDGNGTGFFISDLNNLIPDTKYYVRAYATNSGGIYYGNEENFITDSSSITVTSPNGGENLDVGSFHTITWTSEGTIENVRIDYSINGGNSWIGVTDSAINDGNFNWFVPYTPSYKCLVRISDSDNDGGPSDISDGEFSIVSQFPGSLTVRSPNGGENWVSGSTQPITWMNTGVINNVSIEYSIDKGTTWRVISQSTGNDGSFNWLIPGTISDHCLVRVSAIDGNTDPRPWDVSNAVFSIIPPSEASLEITTPNGGEKLFADSTYTIQWIATNSREDVLLEYSSNGGDTWTEITPSTENDGKYDWIVPNDPSDNCKVRISETSGGLSDMSDAVFSIVETSASGITVTSPNGGEIWDAGSIQVVKWTSGGGIDNVTIEYSRDNGSTWQNIVHSTPDDGNFDWHIPEIASDECLIRVSAINIFNDPIPWDVSDGVFSIIPPESPTIRITAPNGGEQLLIGSWFRIKWDAILSREDVKIEYSVNGGDTWNIITLLAENKGEYNWFVPDNPSETCLVRISETDGQPVDVSDTVFSIIQPETANITITSPNGGESWAVNSIQQIKWTSSGDINNVSIEYSADVGTTWELITSNTANDGSFDWTIPNTVSDLCLVRISATDDDLDPKSSDISDQLFSIIPESVGEFRVMSPNGGEEWEVGSTQAITWSNNGSSGNVMIEFSPDSGSTWSIITSSTINNGSYNWLVPAMVSSECLIRVSVNDGGGDPKPSDTSDSEFSIVHPSAPTLRVISPNGGEELIVGSLYEISWYSNNSRENIRIEYSTSGGETWTKIIGSTENDGEYDWDVPNEPSQICLIRISEIDGQPLDVSDSTFSIVQPSEGNIVVVTPNGGENLETGTEYNITWVSRGIENVIIEYSLNNGETWVMIDKVPANMVSYPWTIPGTPSEMCLVRITGADADENSLDISDGVFTIFDPSQKFIEVITPNGGENLSIGEEYYITWESAGINSVRIEYSTNNGEQWIYIDTASAIGGRYIWSVPNTPTETCRIRITGNDTAEDPSDVSDAVFSIIAD